jgi:hypothetical protein
VTAGKLTGRRRYEGWCPTHRKELYLTRKWAKATLRAKGAKDGMRAYLCKAVPGYWHVCHMPEEVIRGEKTADEVSGTTTTPGAVRERGAAGAAGEAVHAGRAGPGDRPVPQRLVVPEDRPPAGPRFRHGPDASALSTASRQGAGTATWRATAGGRWRRLAEPGRATVPTCPHWSGRPGAPGDAVRRLRGHRSQRACVAVSPGRGDGSRTAAQCAACPTSQARNGNLMAPQIGGDNGGRPR